MKKLLTLFTASFLALASTSLFAQNYYVCDTGDDSNNGLSESSPFRSHEKAIEVFNTISSGESVLFCRGGVFQSSTRTRISNKNCMASSACTLADYGDTQKGRPSIIINGGDDGMRFSHSGEYAENGYVVKNIILMSSTNTGVGIFFYTDVNDVVLENMHIEGFSVGVHVADSKVDRITLKNSNIIKNVRQGWLGGCDDCLIENNHFENNGKSIFDHNIYLSPASKTESATGMTVRGNTLYKSSMVDGKCKGVSLVAHGLFDNLIIENNLIKEDVGAVTPNCWGISVDPGYEYEEVFHNVVIKGNKLLNVGNVGIGCASCDGVIIEDNTIIDEDSVLSFGIKVPVRKEDTIKSKNVVVLNNTILMSSIRTDTAGITVGGLNAAVVKNNTISLPVNVSSQGMCIKTTDASANIDISSNTCKSHTSVTVIDKTIDESTKVLASTEPTSTASTSTEPTSTASTSTEPTSTASTSTEPTSTVPTSTASTSADSTSTASASTEPTSTTSTSTELTTITKISKSSIKVVSLGNYKSSRGRSSGIGFKVKCRAEAADGRCLLQ